MSFKILGIATAVPKHRMTQDEAMTMAAELVCRDERETRLTRTMYRQAHIKQRYTCVPYQDAYHWVGNATAPSASPGRTTGERMQIYAEHAGPLAAKAAIDAIQAARVKADTITHLVTVSCTGFDAPGIDIQLLDLLGLPKTTERLHIGYMGCHGALNGLRAARGLVAAEREARVLLCAVELCSLHYRFQWNDDQIPANALFGDGAAALVGANVAIDEASDEASDEANVPAIAATASGSCILDESQDAITWRVGDHGFEMSLSNRVPQLIQDQLGPWLTQWLAKHGESLESIQGWAVHPGGPRILRAVEGALELDKDALAASREVLAEYGNMSSPTVLFVLKKLLDRNTPRPYVALGFGPGVAAEVTLLR